MAGGSAWGVPLLSPLPTPTKELDMPVVLQRDVGCPTSPDSLCSLPTLGPWGWLRGVAGPPAKAEPALPLPFGVMGMGPWGAGMSPSHARGQGLVSALG